MSVLNNLEITIEPKIVVSDGRIFDADLEEVGRAIQIPKGHGNIKDVSELEKDGRFAWRIALTPTILEAEK